METLEQKRNRDMANILMVACLISMLRKWRIKQDEYEEWEANEELKKYSSKPPKPSKMINHPILEAIMFILGIEKF